MVEVYAPGKLVLLGEYAVLDGAPALVAAVDRGVRCVVTEGEGWTTPGDDRFVREALQGAPEAHYTFSDWNPVHVAGKPGFGGSAAATVAACLAAFGPTGLEARALGVHHTVQGSGSGIDVRASVAGGVRAYVAAGDEPVPAALAWQSDLPLSAIYSGRSAETGPRVRRYLAWADEAARAAFVRDSAELLSIEDPVAALHAGREMLVAMSRAAGLDYLTPALDRICALAKDHGGAAKPSGAGGGDVAVALVVDPQARSHFEAACGIEGLPAIAVRVSAGAWRRSGNHA